MDASEAVRAMMGGKTVRRSDQPTLEFRFLDGKVEARYGKGSWDVCYIALQSFLESDAWEVVKEYPLTFGEAVGEAMKGNLVANEAMPELLYTMDHGVLRYMDVDGLYNDGLDGEEIEAGWKVIATRRIGE